MENQIAELEIMLSPNLNELDDANSKRNESFELAKRTLIFRIERINKDSDVEWKLFKAQFNADSQGFYK